MICTVETKKEGEPFWTSPWCDGRPGWHLSAPLCQKNIWERKSTFTQAARATCVPHHENEIAQSKSYNGKQFARYWLHNAFFKY